MKHFAEVLRYLSSIEYINRGGCGIAALAIHRWLEKNGMLKDTKIVFLYDYMTHMLYNTNYEILNKNRNGIPEGAPHIVVKRLNKYLDSEGYLKKTHIDFRYSNKLEVDTDFLLTAINNNRGKWNELFDRKKQIPKIAKNLNIDLSDVVIFN